jgi:hypothetical protein
MAYLQAGRQCVPAPLIRAGWARSLIKQILKFNFAFLEPGGVDVGKVVRNDVQVKLLGFHSRGG